jgi:hypothetical protein
VGKDALGEAAVDQRTLARKEHLSAVKFQASSSQLVKEISRRALRFDTKVQPPKPLAIRRGIEEVCKSGLVPDVHGYLLGPGSRVHIDG